MKKLIIFIGLILCFAVSQAWAGDNYVDAAATGSNDGGSWTDAFTDLQDALNPLVSGVTSGDTIHVAEGTYKPGDARTDTFSIPDGVTLLGGYPAGGGEVTDRDPATYETILSGDIGTPDDNSDNSYHVVYINGTSFIVEMDGFTITGGSETNGAALHVVNPTVGFSSALDNIDFNTITLTNMSITGNSSSHTTDTFVLDPSYGGAMFVTGSEVVMTNVTISGNSFTAAPPVSDATWYSGYGGGIFALWSKITMTSVTISDNSINGIFDSDFNLLSGGGGHFFMSDVSMDNVTISGNIIDGMNSPLPVNHSHGGGLSFYDSGVVTMKNVTVTENSIEQSYNAQGGGIRFEYYFESIAFLPELSLSMTDVTISNNTVTGSYCLGGGIYASIYNPFAITPETLTAVTISGNMAIAGVEAYGGGMLALLLNDKLSLNNVTISGNSATSAGSMAQGGGIWYGFSSDESANQGTLTNMTVSGNSVTSGGISEGGGLYYSSYLNNIPIDNTILWDNTPDQLVSNSDPEFPGAINLYNCVVQGGYGGGTDIIVDDPNLGTLGNYGGYTQTIPLLEGSSAIDAANATYAPTTDQRGVARDSSPDIGAYEDAKITVTPFEPVPVGTEVNAYREFNGDISAPTWDWGDETSSTASVNDHTVTGSHTYESAGVYTVTLTVTIGSVEYSETYEFVVVYDLSAVVTGNGWINSPEGAYVVAPTLSGKARFGFVSKYNNGATVPTGHSQFKFKAGDLNFRSTSYDWLLVTGSDYAKFKGTGTINGEGSYKFQVWAGDGDPDTFRIKIWTEDESGTETVVYDNNVDQAIMKGSIAIHG